MALHKDDSDVIKIHSFDGQTVWYDRLTALFEVGNFLGGGAAGNVYECEHVKSREHFALKILNPLGYKLLSSMILRKCNIVSKGEAFNDGAEIDRVVVLGKHHVWWLINGGTKQFIAAYFSIKHNCLKEFSLNQCIHVWGSNPSGVNDDESGNKDEIVEAVAPNPGGARIYVPAVPPKFADFVRKRNRIFREIQNMRKIRVHVNVIRLEGVLELTQDSKCTIFLVMELANGGELFDRIKLDCGAREATAKLFFQQLLRGVMHCHNHGVCHRDLKPENLLLQDCNEKGTVLKIADFGFSARFAMGDSEATGIAHHNDDWKGAMSMTSVGHQMCPSRANALPFAPTHSTSTSLPDESLLRVLKSVVGSPFYVAPEVLQARGYDGPKADVWSLGVILYAMLAGNLPFEQELSSCKRFRLFCKWIREQTAKGLRFWNDQSVEYPQWLFPAKFSMLAKGLIVAMLHPDPDKRISVSEAMRHPLCTAGLSSSTSQHTLQQQQTATTNNINCHPLSSLPVAVAAAASAPAAAPDAAIMQLGEGGLEPEPLCMPIASAISSTGLGAGSSASASIASRSGLSRSIEAINTTVARAVCVETAEEVVAMAVGNEPSLPPSGSVAASGSENRGVGSAVVVVQGEEVKADPTVTLPPLSQTEDGEGEGSPMEVEQDRLREDDAEVEKYDLRGESREETAGSFLDYGYGLSTNGHENFCGDDDVMFYMDEDGLRGRSSSNSSFQQHVAAGGQHSPHVSFNRAANEGRDGTYHQGRVGGVGGMPNDSAAVQQSDVARGRDAYGPSIPGRPSLPFPDAAAGGVVGRLEQEGRHLALPNPFQSGQGPDARRPTSGGGSSSSLMHLPESPSGSMRGLTYSPQFEPPVAPMLFTSRSIDDLIATHDNVGDDEYYSPVGHSGLDDTAGMRRQGSGGNGCVSNGSGNSAHVPTFSDSVKRSTRFITAVPAAEVLRKVESILEQFRQDRTQTPIGIVSKVEVVWEDFRLEVWGSDTSGPALCALQLYQLPPSSAVTGTLLSESSSPARFFTINPSPGNSNPPSPATFGLTGSSKSVQGLPLPAPLSSLAQQGSPFIQVTGGRVSPLAFPFRSAPYEGSPPMIYSFGGAAGGPQQQQQQQQSQQLFLAEFVRGQLEIFAFKRFYQWVRQRLSEVVKRDYNFKLLDHGSTPTDSSFLMNYRSFAN